MLAAIETKENEPIPVFRGRERCKAEKRTYSTRSTMLVIISNISLRFCKVFSLLPQTVNVTGQRRSRASLLPLAEISCIPWTSRLPMRLPTCLFTTMKLCESSPPFFRHLILFPHLIPTSIGVKIIQSSAWFLAHFLNFLPRYRFSSLRLSHEGRRS